MKFIRLSFASVSPLGSISSAYLATFFRNGSLLAGLLLLPALTLGQTFVQQNSNPTAVNSATVSVTYTAAETAGDLNVVPTDRDIYPTKSWDKDALIQPKSRAAFASLVAQGWTDAIRTLHPSKPMFSFWDYKRNRWPRDAGLRLDHLLLSPALAPRLTKAGVDRKIRGEEGASDHAPAWIVLK